MSFTKYENILVYKKVLVVKKFTIQKIHCKKVWELQIKFREFDC